MNNTVFTPSSICIALLLSGSLVTSATASPWLEANNPFVRSSLLTLSDSNVIRAPVGTYPLRWASIGDELVSFRPQNNQVNLNVSQQEILYTLNSAKLNRGNRQFKVTASRYQPYEQSFGEINQDHWGAVASYEQLENSFAFRISSGYRDYNSDQEFTWHNSYLSFNAGDWLLSVGNLNRWWGQGWQHSLILNTKAKNDPDLSLSYMGDNSLFGLWNIETLVNKPDESEGNYYSGTRFNARPLSFFEYGITYQYWDRDTTTKQQWAFDTRLTMPSIEQIQHSLYAEVVTDYDDRELGAWLVGWTGSRAFGQQILRLVLEMQKNQHDVLATTSDEQQFISSLNTTYLRDNSYSAALYMQFSNDHNASVRFQSFDINSPTITNNIELIQTTYQLPALAGIVSVGVDYTLSSDSHSKHNSTLNYYHMDETNVWGSYEFRF